MASSRPSASSRGGGGLTLSVAVLGFPLTARVWGGISWATYRLLEAISREFPEDTFHLLLHEEPAGEFGRATMDRLVEASDNLSTVMVPRGRDAARWCEANADVVWGPASGVLPTSKVPQVFTHHDMRMFGPLRESWSHYMRHRAGLNKAMRAAKVAVVPSPSTQREMLEHYKGARYSSMTCTIPWGVPAGFGDPAAIEPQRPDFVEGHQFISAIYDPFPHKHMEFLELTVPLLEEHGWDLVVMGGMRGEGMDITIDHPNVHYPGFVDYDLLPAYIKASSLFLFPSEYEGFGFPPYEAMALGVPVLYNRRCRALADVVGDRAWSFSNEDGMVDTLGRLMGSEEDRRSHVNEGLALAAAFDWDLAARRYMYVLRMAHEYRKRTLDFAAADPEPPMVAVTECGTQR